MSDNIREFKAVKGGKSAKPAEPPKKTAIDHLQVIIDAMREKNVNIEKALLVGYAEDGNFIVSGVDLGFVELHGLLSITQQTVTSDFFGEHLS